MSLELLTEPLLEEVEADERATELEEGIVDVIPALVADDEAPHLVQPGDGALDDPAVTAQPLGGVHLRAGDAALDAPLAQDLLVPAGAVALVRMQLLGPLARPTDLAAHGRDGVEQGLQDARLVHVGCGRRLGEWEALAISDDVPLRARLRSVRGVRPCLGAPFFAGTVEASMAALDQSIRSAPCRRFRSSCWSFSHTPASVQSRSRRQQVMPEPQPISCGSISQGMPLFRTKTIPVRQARSGIRGRPPLGFGFSGGRSGSMISHNSSGTSGVAMSLYPRKSRSVRSS